MKTLHYSMILIALVLFTALLASTNAHATCIIVNGAQECADPPSTLTSIKSDHLVYENSDKPVIIIIGVPHSQVYLEINDSSGNIVFSHSIEVLSTGVANYTLDISSYKLGIYSAIASTSASKVTTSFTVNLGPSGPVITLNVVKDMYIPGDFITILGTDGPNNIIQLSLTDPNDNIVKSIQTYSDKTGQFSSSDLKIPTNAIPGVWKINAIHNISHASLEIKVNSSTSTGVMKNNTNTMIPTHGSGGSIVAIPIELPLKQFKSGIKANNVICKTNFTLIFKSEDGSPACVKPDTTKILVERGWAKTS